MSISSFTSSYTNSLLVSSLFTSDTSTSDALSNIITSAYSDTTEDDVEDTAENIEDIDLVAISQEALDAYQSEIDSVSIENPNLATKSTLYGNLVTNDSDSSSSSIYDASDIISAYY